MDLPENSITTSHCVGTLFSQSRRGVIKCPAHGTRRRISREAGGEQGKGKDREICVKYVPLSSACASALNDVAFM